MDLTLKFIVWLIFSKYSVQKLVSYFSNFEHDFEKRIKGCFQDTKNVFNDIIVNKLKIVDPTI